MESSDRILASEIPSVKPANRFNMFALLVTFLLPVLLAALAFKFQWFTPASTNLGQLLTPSIQLDKASMPDSIKGKWLLILPTKASCHEKCQQGLYISNQVHLALGKEMDRAANITLGSKIPDLDSIHFFTQIDEQLSTDQLYISDPLGNVILTYPIKATSEDNILTAKSILLDFKKLLKLSRIG